MFIIIFNVKWLPLVADYDRNSRNFNFCVLVAIDVEKCIAIGGRAVGNII